MNPRSTLVIVIATLLLILSMGGVAIYILFFAPEQKVSVSPDPFSKLLSFSDSKGDSARLLSDQGTQDDVVKTEGTIPVRTFSGVIEVRDFTKDADVAIATGGDAFYVAFPKEFEFSDAGLEYEFGYIPDEQRIYVYIYKEPIGEIRRKSTDNLMQRLGLSEKDICTLDILVVAPRWVSEYYADKNLGFPGCPGAIQFQAD
ncbi:MAG: hypothetical protein Greene07147_739 [Parcubacteria group bacterium Greene0714_7]|nr:MAG: hypothetical protein Greene07147_739 [Parcubacteria group bacterium Greene0714_7]